MKRIWIDRLLKTRDHDPGCDACFGVLDEYVDAVLRGDDPAGSYPDVATHLLHCDACREDTEGLIAALKENSDLDT
jgi:hypothetical protein